MAQGLLKIQEIDNEGQLHAPLRVADINSDIQISIDKEKLRRKLGQYLPENSQLGADSLFRQIDSLQSILAQGLPLLSRYEANLRKWQQQSEEEKDTRALLHGDSTVVPLAKIRLKLNKFSTGTPLRDKLNEMWRGLPAGASELVIAQAIFKTTEEYLTRLKNELEDILEQDTANIQLGAWINSRNGLQPVHLPGFDQFQQGERYEVGRFNFAMAGGEKEDLEQMALAADSIGRFGIQPGLKAFTENIKPGIRDLLVFARNVATKFAEESLGENSSLTDQIPGLASPINNLQDVTSQYITFLKSLEIKYIESDQGPSVDVVFIAQSVNDLASFMSNTKNLIDAVGLVKESVLGLTDAQGSLAASFIKSTSSFEKDLEYSGHWADQLAAPGGYLLGVKKVNDELLQFSEEVMKHSLSTLPSETRFSLLHAGPREDGDFLVIRLAMSTKDSPQPQTLERRDLRLYRVQFYVETKASMAFVDHLAETQEERKQFQLAPSYSVLFKWGKRNKVAFNQFWRPGIGLNIASPDLRLDEAPDIALSLTGSVINDWIQAGAGCHERGGGGGGACG